MTSEAAKTKYSAHRETFKITFDLAGAYARWLLSTLLLLNSGAIAGLFQKDEAATHVAALCFFATGIFCALLAGIVGWFNLQIASTYLELCSTRVLSDQPEPPLPSSLSKTTKAAVFATFASIACLAIGGALVVFSLR